MGKGEESFFTTKVMLCGLAVTCRKAVRDGVGKGAAQPVHFLILKPGAGRGRVEL